MKKHYEKSPYKESGIIAYVRNKMGRESKLVKDVKKELKRRKK